MYVAKSGFPTRCFILPQSARGELEKLRLHEQRDQAPGDSSLKDRASMVAHCLEHRDDKLRHRTRKHRSLYCLEDTEAEAEALPGPQKGPRGAKTLGKAEDRNGRATLDADHKLPSQVIRELSVVLQRSRTLPKELPGEQILQKEIK